jgi:DNA-binding CsgD family transcriptional regulator
MTDPRSKRHLSSLEPMLHKYCAQVWFTVRRAKRAHGADPNAAREPGNFGRQVRIVARLVDVLLGANVGVLETAIAETEGEASKRLSSRLDNFPALAAIYDGGIDAVFRAADMTPGECEVERCRIEGGLTLSQIAVLTGRQEGTVKALHSRALYRLRALPFETEELAA